MEPRFVTKPAFTIVGLLLRATPMTPEIPKLWDRFGSRIDEIPHLSEANVSYGMMGNYDPQTNQFDYMAGCAVDTVDALPEEMRRWDVPANTYAVFEATLSTLGQVFDAIYNKWLPDSGYTYAPGPYFERYGYLFNPEDPESPLSVYIPVEKKA